MNKQFDELTDSQWQCIKDFFQEQVYCTLSLRTVLNAIFWILRTGSQWRNLDSRYPNFNAVYYHYAKWKRDGRFEKINQLLNEKIRKEAGRNPHPSLVSVDSQSVKVAPFINEDKGIDGNKKINGRKRHIVTDTMGLVIGVIVSSANQHDGTMGIQLFGQIKTYLHRTDKVLADGTYRGSFETFIKEQIEAEVEIAAKPPTQKGFVPVKFRWTVERTFGWFNFFRRLAKDYEKKAKSAATWILLANSAVLLNRIS